MCLLTLDLFNAPFKTHMTRPRLEYPCGVCENEVTEEQKAVQCDGQCQSWYHCMCVDISDLEYNVLASSDGNWECTNCKSSLPGHNTVDAIDVFHFDFQKNLPTPKLTVGSQFYLRLLWTYLFGIYSASTKLMIAYMWHELMAKRGPNDVISCINHFIFNTSLGRTGAKWSIWWADNCPGQNKNNYVIWFFQDLIRRGVYTRIDFKFLIAGHTYGPTDRHFALIEKHTAKVETVFTPSQWFDEVRKAVISTNSKIEVVEMTQSTFRDFRGNLRNLYTERSKDKCNKPLDFASAVWFNFGLGELYIDSQLKYFEHQEEVWVRHTYDVFEVPQRVCYRKKRGVKNVCQMPPSLYEQYPIPIKRAKAEDLKKLVTSYIPREYQHFYSELPTINDSNDSSDDDI